MNRSRISLILASLVLGLGTMASASANQRSIEETLNQSIIEQTKQVSQYLSHELNNSIQTQLKAAMTIASKPMVESRDLVAQINQTTKSVVQE